MIERLLVGIATGGKPVPAFVEAFAKLTLPAGIDRLQRSLAFGNYVPAQRELIAFDAVEGQYDWLFFVDDDIVLPPDALERLLETARADARCAVVGGLYWSRDSVRPIVVDGWTSDDTSTAWIPGFTSHTTAIVAGIGFGCALIRVAALSSLAEPYFPAHVMIDRVQRIVRICDEDYRFCERIRGGGWTVRLDARVRCGHFDRTLGHAVPEVWEADAATSEPRMLVQRDGRAQLVPLDADVPRIAENHRAADLTYIIV